MVFLSLVGSALFAIYKEKAKLVLKRLDWGMKRWCILMKLMNQNGCVDMPAGNASTCLVLQVIHNCRAIMTNVMAFDYTWVYSKDDTMAHAHRLMVIS